MGPVAGRWWRWLRGDGPLEILPGRPLPAAAAWLLALALTGAVDLASPGGQALLHAPWVLAVEAALLVLVLVIARRRHRLAQALQVGGLLAGLRNLILAPCSSPMRRPGRARSWPCSCWWRWPRWRRWPG